MSQKMSRETVYRPLLALLCLSAVAGCEESESEQPAMSNATDIQALRVRVAAKIPELPSVVEPTNYTRTPEMVELGRQLYFERRLSKNQEISCNSCHDVSSGGADTRPQSVAAGTSEGHNGAFGGRNTPTSFNAALHLSQFWDGRAVDVEAQARGPILAGVEMAMPSEAAAVAVLESIPEYLAQFEAAFPNDVAPITYDNATRAIGAYERGLITPGPLDAFLGGEDSALNPEQLAGLSLFMDTGCIDCHAGPAIGGESYKKMGLIKPYELTDDGRFEVTQDESDRYLFKVPGLRNIALTGPYLHDGSVKTLAEIVDIMSEYQTENGPLDAADNARIVAFLEALTGTLPEGYGVEPKEYDNGPNTPAPSFD